MKFGMRAEYQRESNLIRKLYHTHISSSFIYKRLLVIWRTVKEQFFKGGRTLRPPHVSRFLSLFTHAWSLRQSPTHRWNRFQGKSNKTFCSVSFVNLTPGSQKQAVASICSPGEMLAPCMRSNEFTEADFLFATAILTQNICCLNITSASNCMWSNFP